MFDDFDTQVQCEEFDTSGYLDAAECLTEIISSLLTNEEIEELIAEMQNHNDTIEDPRYFYEE